MSFWLRIYFLELKMIKKTVFAKLCVLKIDQYEHDKKRNY